MSFALIAAARARLAAALAGAEDRSGDPHPVQAATGLAAWAVALEITDSERVAMREAPRWQDGVLTVSYWGQAPFPAQAAEGGAEVARNIRAAILADPPHLGGTAWEIDPAGFTISHDATERRIVTVEQAFTVRLLEE